MRNTELASMLADLIAAEAMAPWECPCPFEPDPRYELVELIGATPHSLVYLAKDRNLSDDAHDACVAIKITRGAGSESREAVMGRRVSHDNVVRILGRGEIDRSAYVIMECVDGGTLSDLPVPMPARQAADMIERIARGVQAIHAAGICHLDLKPGNVLLDAEQQPKVSDFGLAVENQQSTTKASGGTLAFMAPEQFQGWPGAPPADVYALGGLLYYLLTGRCPNGDDGESAREILQAGRCVDCQPIRSDLRYICARAMASDPRDRHPSAAHFADEIHRWQRHLPIESVPTGVLKRFKLGVQRRPTLTVSAFCVALIIAATAISIIRDQALQIKSQRRAQELAQEKIERMEAEARGYIKTAAIMTSLRPTANPSDQFLPVMVWMEWLLGKPYVTNMDKAELAEQRVQGLASILVQYRNIGANESIAAAMARFAMAQSLIEVGMYEQVDLILDQLEEYWPGDVRETDAFWQSARTMRRAAVLLMEFQMAGAPSPKGLEELDQLIRQLERVADTVATQDLLRRARNRFVPRKQQD